MLSKRLVPILSLVLCLGLVCSLAASGERTDVGPANFSMMHFTDMHINPHLARSGEPGRVRGGETIRWICQEAAKPQELTPLGFTAPPPAFAIATGDLTEYGVIDETWGVFERAFRDLPCPLYVVPGNHDNTWVAMYQIMRERHGGENYSFDKFGCRFVCICSASPQEPVPTIDAKTRAWLRKDLESNPPDTPVFVALHHPPYVNEFAPAEYDTLIDLLRDHNVVLMLYGHGHGVNHRNMDGIDGVMGGSTYGKNAGYALISVQDGTLRVAYHYHRRPTKDKQSALEPGWKTLLEKPLQSTAPRRLFRVFAAAAKGGEPSAARRLPVALEPTGDHARAERLEFSFEIDGAKAAFEHGAVPTHPVWSVDTAKLTPGRHLLTVRGNGADGSQDVRTKTFRVVRRPDSLRWRTEFPAAIKAGPVIAGDQLIVARTDGAVTALDRDTGRKLWTVTTGGEILGTPAWSGHTLVFGSGDGKVHALDDSGKTVWTFDARLPVYGTPLIDDATVYIGDNGGRLHALDLSTGKPRWTFSRADYSIECKPCVWGDLIVFGAWDGYLYGIDRADGKLRWKALGPKSSEGTLARYYAPADCGPLLVGGRLFVCDRGYQLGVYSADGKLESKWPVKVSGIGPAENERAFYARTTDNRVCKFDEQGEMLWQVDVPAGRFPIPPTERGGRVYVCSNRGRLSVLDARDGSLLWTYQTTPGFYVMAPVAVDAWEPGQDRPVCYVAGMDGSLTAVRQRPGSGS